MTCITFSLNEIDYWAQLRWNDEGKTIDCKWGKKMNINNYHDTIGSIRGEVEGMQQMFIDTTIGEFPEDLFEEIKNSK